MAKKTNSTQNVKMMTSRSKGAIGLAVLLAVMIFVSYLAVNGMKLDAEGVKVLRSWVPVSAENWPDSLGLSRNLGGGTYHLFTVAGTDNSPETMDSLKTALEKRLSEYNQTDHRVTVEGDVIRVELPSMLRSEREYLQNVMTTPGIFTLTDMTGNPVITGAFKDVTVGPNSTNQAYAMTVGFDADNTKALKDAHAANAYGYYYAYLDNQLLSYSATINNGKVVFDAGTNLGVASQIAVFGKYPLAASLMYTEAGEVSASGSGFLSVYLIACGLVLLAALVYVLMTGKLTGLSAALTAWSAVMLGFFFYATLVYKTVNIGVLLMLAAGIMFAAYTAIIRTRAIAKAIHDGNTPKSAKKLGLRASGKSVWMAHGAGLALSLIMMIFPFSRVLGYALCCGVAGSAITAPLMRLFMDCFVAITANGKRFGKV